MEQSTSAFMTITNQNVYKRPTEDTKVMSVLLPGMRQFQQLEFLFYKYTNYLGWYWYFFHEACLNYTFFRQKFSSFWLKHFSQESGFCWEFGLMTSVLIKSWQWPCLYISGWQHLWLVILSNEAAGVEEVFRSFT